MAQLAPFPTFLIIGFRRNATRWLRFNLNQHPDICAPPIHPAFFTSDERMATIGLRGYRELFADWNGEEHLGEASWEYVDWAHEPAAAAVRIRRLLPDVRLIALVDNPIVRYQSALRQSLRWGEIPPDTQVEDFWRVEVEPAHAIKLIVEGMQWLSLRPYWDRFGDQLLTLFLDDVRADPAAAYRDVLRHIGADDSFVPPDIGDVRYSDRSVVDIPDPSLSSQQLLYAWNRVDVEGLAFETGRDLSSWDPGVGPDTPTAEQLFQLMMSDATKGPWSD